MSLRGNGFSYDSYIPFLYSTNLYNVISYHWKNVNMRKMCASPWDMVLVDCPLKSSSIPPKEYHSLQAWPHVHMYSCIFTSQLFTLFLDMHILTSMAYTTYVISFKLWTFLDYLHLSFPSSTNPLRNYGIRGKGWLVSPLSTFPGGTIRRLEQSSRVSETRGSGAVPGKLAPGVNLWAADRSLGVRRAAARYEIIMALFEAHGMKSQRPPYSIAHCRWL